MEMIRFLAWPLMAGLPWFELGAIDEGLGLLTDADDPEAPPTSVPQVSVPLNDPEGATGADPETELDQRLEPKASFGSMSSGGLY